MAISLKRHLTLTKRRKVPEDLQLRFLKRLSKLLTEGYSMIDALEIIKWDSQLVNLSDNVIHYLKEGSALDEALENVHFHKTITDYLFFVRTNGDIQVSIDKCVEMYETRLSYLKKMQDIARYPLLLFFVFGMLLYFIKQSVLPSFISLFHSNLEAARSIFIFIKIIEYGVFVFTGSVLLILLISSLWYFNKQKLTIQHQLKIYQKIPIYRHILQLKISFQFSVQLSTTLASGMPLKEILLNMAQQEKQPIIAHYASLMITDLSNGVPVTHLLSTLPFLDPRLARIFKKNTDMQALEKDLFVYADLLTEEIQRSITKLLTFIQPVIFIILGCFVVFIYATLMLPMYQLIKTM